MKLGKQTIVFLAVNKNGDEVILDNFPVRQGRVWTDERSAHDETYFSPEDHNSAIVLPKGTIHRLTGRYLTWENDPISLRLIMTSRSDPTGRKYEDGDDVMENDIIRINGMAHDFKVYYSNDQQCYMCEDLSNGLKYQLNTFNSLVIRKVDN
jgi:hypothetical protein|nr:MAG TPA: hypothetical protein [Caudoviricetes sp.]